MRSHRSAYTLVESLVVIALIGSTLSVIGLTMHGLQRASRRVHERAGMAQSLDRFALRWREDAHGANSVELLEERNDGPAGAVRLVSQNGTSVEYSLEEGVIVRSVSSMEKMIQQDSYRIHLAGSAGWVVDRQRERPLVTLLLHWPEAEGRTLPINQISAAILGDSHAR